MFQADIAKTRIGDDGRFALAGLQGPRRVRMMSGPPGWSLKAVRVNGFDVTDDVLSFGTRQESVSDVEVVLTNAGPTIKGTATDAQGHPAVDYSVVAFSTRSAAVVSAIALHEFREADQRRDVHRVGPGAGNVFRRGRGPRCRARKVGASGSDPEFLRAIFK